MAETLSLRRAASLLGMNHATVSRRLQALEQEQQCHLFERGPGKLRLTMAGQAILAQAREMQYKAEGIQLHLNSLKQQLQGPVRITLGDSLIHLIMPILASFKRQHPDILLEVDISNHLASLQKGEADIALRMTAEPPESLVGRRVGQLSAALYTHKDWRTLFPEVKTPEELPRITWTEAFSHLPDNVPGLQASNQIDISCTVNSGQSMLYALEQGLGAAFMLCCQFPLSDKLIQLSKPINGDITNLWILTHTHLKDSEKIHALMNVLTDELRQHSEIAYQ